MLRKSENWGFRCDFHEKLRFLLHWSENCYLCSVITPKKMKKVVRTVWIATLSGLAFLAARCTSKGLTRAEKRQLVRERDSIQDILNRREGAAVYGSPEIIANYKLENLRMQSRLDTINAQLGEEVDLERSARRVALQERIAELQAALQRREGACVYGSPEIIQKYGEETRRMKDELEAVRKELRDLDKPEGSKINDGKVEALYGVPVP